MQGCLPYPKAGAYVYSFIHHLVPAVTPNLLGTIRSIHVP